MTKPWIEAEKQLIGMILMEPAFARLIPDDLVLTDQKNEILLATIKRRRDADLDINSPAVFQECGNEVPASYLAETIERLPRLSESVFLNILNQVKANSSRYFTLANIRKAYESLKEGDSETARVFLKDAVSGLEQGAIISPMRALMKNYISTISGEFSIKDVYRDLHLNTPVEKNQARAILNHFIWTGDIIKVANRAGVYRRPNRECPVIDFKKAKIEYLDIKLPFDLERYVRIYPKNIILVAGSWNSGKTAFMLEFIKKNMASWPIIYFCSEMGPAELRSRLERHKDIYLEQWNFTAVERTSDFAEVIEPDMINVIDYLEISDSFWHVDLQLREIFEKLNRGIAVVAIQKSHTQELGRGGDFTGQKPRIYITLDRDEEHGGGVVKVIKTKDIVPGTSIVGKEMAFSIEDGWKLIYDGNWSYPRERKYQYSKSNEIKF